MYDDNEIRQLILHIQNESEYVRNTIGEELHRTENPNFVKIALEMLEEDEYEPVRAAIVALRNLTNFNPQQFLSRISEFLLVPSHCASAIWFIWSLGNKSYVPRLLGFLDNEDSEVRYQALRAISRFGYDDLLEIAFYMLNDSNGEIRGLACSILGRYHDSRVVPALISKLKDFDDALVSTVAGRAANQLAVIGDISAVQPLMDTVRYGDKISALRALLALKAISINSLESFFLEQAKHKDRDIRMEALSILMQNPKIEFTDTLISIVQTEVDKNLQGMAIACLMNIGTDKAGKFAEKWIEENERK